MKTDEARPNNPRGFMMMPGRFTECGWQYELVKRDDLISIYKKKKESHKKWSWDVIKMRECPAYEIAGAQIPAKETFPNETFWGIDGFTYTNEKDALAKFDFLLKRREKKEVDMSAAF